MNDAIRTIELAAKQLASLAAELRRELRDQHRERQAKGRCLGCSPHPPHPAKACPEEVRDGNVCRCDLPHIARSNHGAHGRGLSR